MRYSRSNIRRYVKSIAYNAVITWRNEIRKPLILIIFSQHCFSVILRLLKSKKNNKSKKGTTSTLTMCVSCLNQAACGGSTTQRTTDSSENSTTVISETKLQGITTIPSQPHAGYELLCPALRQLHEPAVVGHLMQKRACLDDQNRTNTSENAGSSQLSNAGFRLKSSLKKRWGWVLTAATFMIYFNIVGWVGCYSVLFLSLQEAFGRGATETGWVGNLVYIAGSVSSPLTDCFLRKFSNKKTCILGIITCSASLLSSSFAPRLFYLYFTFSLLYGIGWNLVFKSSIDLLMRYFPDNNCMRATSLALTGSTAGLFCWNPIITQLLDVVGWRNACRISSAVILVLCLIFTLPMKPLSQDTNNSSDPKDNHAQDHSPMLVMKKPKRKTSSLKDEIVWSPKKHKGMVRMPEAWLFAIASIAPAIGMGFYNVNLVSYVTSLGHSNHQGSTVLTITAASETCSKLLFAIFGGSLPFRKVHLIAGISLISTFITLTCAFVTSFPLICVVAVGIGFVKASLNTLPFPVGMEIFGPLKTNESSTLILFSGGIGTLFSGFIIGCAYDASHSYNIPIYVCTGFFILTTICFFLIPLTAKIYKVIRVKVKVDEVTGTAEMVPIVEDEEFIIEEIVTTV